MFKFSIRDLFWLTLVAALASGWLVDHIHLSQSVAGIVRLYDSAATRLNELTAGGDKSEFPLEQRTNPDR